MANLAELEVELREQFQTYRRRLDMVAKANHLQLKGKPLKEFITALEDGNETVARKVLKIEEVKRG